MFLEDGWSERAVEEEEEEKESLRASRLSHFLRFGKPSQTDVKTTFSNKYTIYVQKQRNIFCRIKEVLMSNLENTHDFLRFETQWKTIADGCEDDHL